MKKIHLALLAVLGGLAMLLATALPSQASVTRTDYKNTSTGYNVLVKSVDHPTTVVIKPGQTQGLISSKKWAWVPTNCQLHYGTAGHFVGDLDHAGYWWQTPNGPYYTMRVWCGFKKY